MTTACPTDMECLRRYAGVLEKLLGAAQILWAVADNQDYAWTVTPLVQRGDEKQFRWPEVLAAACKPGPPVYCCKLSELPPHLAPSGAAGYLICLLTSAAERGYLCAWVPEGAGARKVDLEALAALQELCSLVWQLALASEQSYARGMLDERERLRREIHDGISQAINFFLLRLRILSAHMAKRDLRALEAGLRELLALGDEIYRDLRQSMADLRSEALQNLGFLELANRYAREFEAQTGIRTRVVALGQHPFPLDLKAKAHLVRILQEALANVHKHARARHVQIAVEVKEEGDFILRVRDDGCGFDPACLGKSQGEHLGLLSMQERAKALGGRLEINSVPGSGTEINVFLPAWERGRTHEPVTHSFGR